MADESVLVDTNIFLTATTPSRPLHEKALKVLNDWPNRGIALCTSGQILREYLVVATRPKDVNGLGLSATKALHNLSEISGRMHFLSENETVSQRLRTLLQETGCNGKRVHDANIVAIALTHHIAKLVTANPRDFTAFQHHIAVLELQTS